MERIKKGDNPSVFLTSPREKALLNGMIKRLLLTEDYKISPAGEEIFDIQNIDFQQPIAVKAEKIASEFDNWWSVYPPTNNFEFNGRMFKGTRKMNINKSNCKEIFDRYVSLKLFTAEDIIRATDYHINLAKEESYKTGQNKVSYITNSERYLKEKYFEPYIDLSKNKKATGKRASGGDVMI